MSDDRGSMTDPRSWGTAIRDVGPSYAVIFALLAVLAYLAFKVTPVVISLTTAIQQTTDVTASSALRQEHNQTTIIEQHGQMIQQNTEILSVISQQQKELSDQNTRILGLEADEKARSAHDALHSR